MSRILATIAEVPSDLLVRPLDWFMAEHYRHRQFCALMHELARGESFDPEALSAVVAFLRHELGRHLADEEEDFFPLLRRRARPEDDIEQILGRLSGEHEGDRAFAHSLRAHLERCLDAHTAPGQDPSVALALDSFATQEVRHLALENAVVLPLARLRLNADDLQALGRTLAARRGLELAPA
jgi:hemerythrin-like domain-containing protein